MEGPVINQENVAGVLQWFPKSVCEAVVRTGPGAFKVYLEYLKHNNLQYCALHLTVDLVAWWCDLHACSNVCIWLCANMNDTYTYLYKLRCTHTYTRWALEFSYLWLKQFNAEAHKPVVCNICLITYNAAPSIARKQTNKRKIFLSTHQFRKAH